MLILTCCQLRKLAYKIIHSTTKILPAWYACLEELNMDRCTIPRDVSTRWNSTFDMLEIALKYRKAIDSISAERELQLRPFELSNMEWKIAEQLRDILKVSSCLPPCIDVCVSCGMPDPQGCDTVFLLINPQSRDHHPSHGSSG